MYYSEFHNHKWARNLKHARLLLQQNQLDAFYNGQDLPEGDVYPGMRVMAAYWVSVEHEMKLRFSTLLGGANHPGWAYDDDLEAQAKDYFQRYLADMRELVERDGITGAGRIDALAEDGWETPPDWAEQMRAWQQESLKALETGEFSPFLVEAWFNSCLRSVANYNRYLIWGAVNAAALVQREGHAGIARCGGFDQ